MDAQARRAQATVPSRRLSYLLTVCLLAAVYFTAAKLALLAAIPPGYATAVWPPSGIALAAVLLLGSRVWPGIWLGAGLVNVGIQSSLLAATLMATGNTLEALAAAALIRKYGLQPASFERAEDVVEFIAIAALSASVAATVAALPLAFVHWLSMPDLMWNWWTWWEGDTVGIVVVAPLILSWTVPSGGSWSRLRIAEAAALAASSLATTYMVFSGSYLPSVPLTFAILPFIIWAAVRFRQREVATLNAAVCAAAVWFTFEGHGPFAQKSPDTSFVLLMAFISTVVATSLALDAALRERRRAMEALGGALRDLREQALRDPLTSLYNRRFLRDHLPRELVRAKREGAPLAVIMVDLDRFKRINDSAGHATGDKVLADVAALLRRHIRGSDIACRYGGEEFTLVLPKATIESARDRCCAIQAAIRNERDRLLGVTASFGIALFPVHADDADVLVRAADRALYDAKRAGRDQVRIFQG